MQKMPVFSDYSQTNRTAENGLLGIKYGHYPGFSPEGTFAVRLPEGFKANAMRSQTWRFGTSGLTSASGFGNYFRIADNPGLGPIISANSSGIPRYLIVVDSQSLANLPTSRLALR